MEVYGFLYYQYHFVLSSRSMWEAMVMNSDGAWFLGRDRPHCEVGIDLK
jgi:hypothetical protein